ncbi:MBL fold metallo-hydrolase [Roseimaritima multifibrata]|nr:MBL fold metallo-hydrolase [Roseimaritima multifibrata]
MPRQSAQADHIVFFTAWTAVGFFIGCVVVMELHCLGTAGYHPNETRHTSSYFIPEAGLLLDAGTGLFRLPPLIQTDRLDILLSHTHLDHVVGLTFLLGILHQHPVQTVRVWARQEKIDAIQNHLLDPSLFPVPLDVEWMALEEHTPDLLGGGKLTWFSLEHPGGSTGFRIDWPGHSLAYVTDTIADPIADYVGKIRGVNLLLHECNFRDTQRQWAELTGHSWTSRVAAVASMAAVKQLVFVHLNPLETDGDPIDLQAAQLLVPGAMIAEDKQVLQF